MRSIEPFLAMEVLERATEMERAGAKILHLEIGELRTLQILAQNLFISASEFVQQAGLAALAHGEPTVAAMRTAYVRRRDLLVAGLRALGFGVAAAPQGAFYVLADARRWGPDSRRLAARILEEAHVAVTPGIDFGAAGEGFLRFCYANSDDALREALARMERVL